MTAAAWFHIDMHSFSGDPLARVPEVELRDLDVPSGQSWERKATLSLRVEPCTAAVIEGTHPQLRRLRERLIHATARLADPMPAPPAERGVFIEHAHLVELSVLAGRARGYIQTGDGEPSIPGDWEQGREALDELADALDRLTAEAAEAEGGERP